MKKIILSLFTVGFIAAGCNASQDQTVSFNTKQSCAEQAQAFLKHAQQIDSPENGVNANYVNEQYTYNSTLNTCLVYFEVYDQGGVTYSIVDVLTNKRMYQYDLYYDQNTQKLWDTSCKPADGCFTSKEDFMAKFNTLFNK